LSFGAKGSRDSATPLCRSFHSNLDLKGTQSILQMYLLHLDIWIMVMLVFSSLAYQIKVLSLKHWALITQLSLVFIPGFFSFSFFLSFFFFFFEPV
jgi:hypothetical protein